MNVSQSQHLNWDPGVIGKIPELSSTACRGNSLKQTVYGVGRGTVCVLEVALLFWAMSFIKASQLALEIGQ